MMKALKKLGIEGMFLNIYDKTIGYITLNGQQMKPFVLKSGMGQ
jgi:hypothetical protein